MGVSKFHVTESGMNHLTIACLMMTSINESIDVNENNTEVPIEHSKESIKRRILQIRQELNLFERGLR